MCHIWGRKEAHTRLWWGNLRERDHIENLGIDGRIMLKWILKESVGRAWSGFFWLRLGTWGDCKKSNEPSGFRKCREFVNWLLSKDSAPWSWLVSVQWKAEDRLLLPPCLLGQRVSKPVPSFRMSVPSFPPVASWCREWVYWLFPSELLHRHYVPTQWTTDSYSRGKPRAV